MAFRFSGRGSHLRNRAKLDLLARAIQWSDQTEAEGCMVHRKNLFTGQILYFRHAPPTPGLDSASDSRPLSPPFKDAPRYKCSMYYFWWAFLRENDEYIACCVNGGEGPMANLYRDFVDVRGDDFMDWWIDGGRLLFCEPLEDAVTLLHDSPRHHDSEHRVLISVPKDGDLDRITAEIRTAMGEYRLRYRPADELRESRARYPIMATAKLQSLYRQLRTYQLKKADPEIGNKAIAEELKIGDTSESYNPDSIIAAVSRYFTDAQKLVANVGKGRFPDYSDPPKEPELFG